MFRQSQVVDSSQEIEFSNISHKLDDTMLMSKMPDFGSDDVLRKIKDNLAQSDHYYIEAGNKKEKVNLNCNKSKSNNKSTLNESIYLKSNNKSALNESIHVSVPNDIDEVLRLSRQRKTNLRASQSINDSLKSKDSDVFE